MILTFHKRATPSIPRIALFAAAGLLIVTASLASAQLSGVNGATEPELARAIAENRELLRKYPAHDFTPAVMFQLCELYVRRSTIAHQTNMALYEAELKRLDAGELTVEPALPRVDFHEAITLAEELVEKYPTANFIDRVLYRLGLCYREEGKDEASRAHLERLVTEYPRSDYALEGHFRLGEHYFEKRDYARAVAAYTRLLDKWDHPFFDMALYKLGWSYYNVNDYAKAISTFTFLIDDLDRLSRLNDSALLGKTKVDLRKEALEYIAVCFADLGGPRKAEEFYAETLSSSDAQAQGYVMAVFLRLADIYQDRNDYNESTATLETILRRWPLHEQAPQLQNKVVENHVRAGNADKAEAAREALVKNYGPGSFWLNSYSGKSAPHRAEQARRTALALAEQSLYLLGNEAQARAMKEGQERDYLLAIDRYRDFLQKFPQSPDAAKIQYYQAECYYELKAFAAAAEAYQKAVVNYPRSEFAAEAARNRVLAHVEEISRLPAADSVTCSIGNFLGTGENPSLRVPHHAYAKLLIACNDYCIYPAGTDKLPDVLMKYGETLYTLEQFKLARRIYEKVATMSPPNKFVLPATAMVAQCEFRAQDYAKAEKWCRAIAANFPDSTRQVDRAQKMIASARFKLAENMKSNGNSELAAQAFENLARSSHDPEITERSLIAAASLFEKTGDKQRALATYERLHETFPASVTADEALFRAGQLAEDLNDWRRAIQNYMILANAFPDSALASKGLFRVGQCHETIKDFAGAISAFRRYKQTYPDDPAQLLEAITALGIMYYNQGHLHLSLLEFQETLSAYRQFRAAATPVDEYLPAQAQFMIGEIRFQSYRQIELASPLDRSFQNKQALFNEVLAAYRDAAEYGVAEWTTAATYKIGATFEEFCRALWEAPRPAGLAEADAAHYEASLQQKIRPFKERALETYRANLRLAEENDVRNEWVDNSRKRVDALMFDLGLASLGTAIPVSLNGTAQ